MRYIADPQAINWEASFVHDVQMQQNHMQGLFVRPAENLIKKKASSSIVSRH